MGLKNLFSKEKVTDVAKNSTINIISENLGVPYQEVMNKAKHAKEKYGISYMTFGKKGFFNASEEEMQAYKEKADKKEEDRYQKMAIKLEIPVEEAKAKADRETAKYGVSFLKYFNNRLYLLSEAEAVKMVNGWEEEKEAYIKRAVLESGWTEKQVKRHMKKCDLLWGIDLDHYMAFKAWEVDDETLSQYTSIMVSRALMKKYNHSGAKYFSNKELFDDMFSEFTKRKFWVNKDTNFEEFEEFLKDTDEIFAKPTDSCQSRGAMKIKIDENTDHKALYDQLMVTEKLIVEQCVKQHPELDKFDPGCVNTVRAVTILKDDVCHLAFALLKVGNGGIADNLVRGGMAAAIDTKTGIIMADGVDVKGNRYECHPTSGQKFKGFQIPNWDALLETVDKAIRVVPGMNYIGWDIAITPDGVTIIEGNTMAGLGLCQLTLANEKKGVKPYFDPFI
ncbi:MAG: hypothetical protein MJ146_03110 [Clostridia bacterium]|nr:hypothetical protein [Clostridia bacterium]